MTCDRNLQRETNAGVSHDGQGAEGFLEDFEVVRGYQGEGQSVNQTAPFPSPPSAPDDLRLRLDNTLPCFEAKSYRGPGAKAVGEFHSGASLTHGAGPAHP